MGVNFNPNNMSSLALRQQQLQQQAAQSDASSADDGAGLTDASGTQFSNAQMAYYGGASTFDASGAAVGTGGGTGAQGHRHGGHGMKAVEEVAQASGADPSQVWQQLLGNDPTTVSQVTSQLASDFSQRYPGLSATDANLMATQTVQGLQQRAASGNQGVGGTHHRYPHGIKAAVEEVAQASGQDPSQVWQALLSGDASTVESVTSRRAQDVSAQFPNISSDDALRIATDSVSQVQQRAQQKGVASGGQSSSADPTTSTSPVPSMAEFGFQQSLSLDKSLNDTTDS